ncbi:MAG: rhodanese-like domain-containing protein [Tatlockia sp.]|nr:rhodanese-like domain-containing protein [Tatlockia sp.]
MEQLGQFLFNHWILWTLLILMLILIYINEFLSQKKRAKEVSPQEAVNLINHENAVVFDLRDVENFTKGHIIDARQTSAEDFSKKNMDKYKDKPLILVCAKGLQSTSLATKLKEQGFVQAMALAGGLAAWQAADLPIIKGK